MTTGKTAERFLELEARANELLNELARLRKETIHYSKAAGTLDQVSENVSSLVDKLEKLTEGLRDAVGGLRELGVGDLVDHTSKMAAQLDSLMEYQSKGFFGRLFGKPRTDRP